VNHSQRRFLLILCWIVAAGWGVFYLAVLAPTSVGYGGMALFHFLVGYVWGTAAMAAPLTSRLALFGTFLSGAFARAAFGSGTVELYFAWAGLVAAIALSDTTRPRNIAYSVAAFVAGVAVASVAFLGG
jgi:hypothetical protein